MKNKVISILDEMIESNKKSFDYMTDKLAGPVRENFIKELKERIQSLPDDDWIVMTDRLPEEGKMVLISEGGCVIHGYVEGGKIYKFPTDKLS